jgi:DNA-binding CsgD family transcriptional regulator
MTPDDRVARGREAFARHAWSEACALFAEADVERPLGPPDLQRHATAAYLSGLEPESTALWTRAHREFLRVGDLERAARCAFWLADGLHERHDHARALAWVARAQRLLDENVLDCVEHGYLRLSVAYDGLFKGDVSAAFAGFSEAAEIAERFDDPDLIALTRHCIGRVLIRKGQPEEGVRLLDAAMVVVDAGEVSPLVVGDVYCSVIEGCLEIFDLRRAHEWTAALTQWCESQPDLIPFSGQCLVRRAEILCLHGAWAEAGAAAASACDRLMRRNGHPASGSAFYQRGELHRLRGEFAEAEEAYRTASRYGRPPQPGMALLRLLQDQTEAAAAAIRLAMDEARSSATRARLLPGYVEVMLAAGDVATARAGAEELAALARDLDATPVHAAAAQARGAVLLAEGDGRAALADLRKAWSAWREIEAPYEAARVRVVIGQACRALGDRDAAAMEFDAARWLFAELGARPDLLRVEALCEDEGAAPTAGNLSPRELQVLRHVSAGKTNRAIAAELFISERTVERHVSNIFVKLNVSSRAAATAFAYEHDLV